MQWDRGPRCTFHPTASPVFKRIAHFIALWLQHYLRWHVPPLLPSQILLELLFSSSLCLAPLTYLILTPPPWLYKYPQHSRLYLIQFPPHKDHNDYSDHQPRCREMSGTGSFPTHNNHNPEIVKSRECEPQTSGRVMLQVAMRVSSKTITLYLR